MGGVHSPQPTSSQAGLAIGTSRHIESCDYHEDADRHKLGVMWHSRIMGASQSPSSLSSLCSDVRYMYMLLSLILTHTQLQDGCYIEWDTHQSLGFSASGSGTISGASSNQPVGFTASGSGIFGGASSSLHEVRGKSIMAVIPHLVSTGPLSASLLHKSSSFS